MKVVRVGLDVPLARLFDYLASDPPPRLGERVLVPFGRRRMVGVALEVAASSEVPPERLRSIIRTLPEGQFTADDLRLLRFAADYYHYPLGQVVLNALPQKLKRVGREKELEAYAVTEAGLAAHTEALPPQARVRRALLVTFQARRVLTLSAVSAAAARPREALKDFLTRGWIARCPAPVGDDAPIPAASPAPTQQHALTAEQRAAVQTISSGLGRFQPFLLCGVTGSGKTEVYLRVCEAALASRRQVLFLVPEIALTPQLEAMVQGRFPATPLVSLHSGLSEAERARNWLAAHSGRARIVLGTRLAVFTPLPDLGLIVVDEEHDGSLKQTEGCCYSARDLAVVRASQRRVPVVLGSATPALESYHNATVGRYRLVELPTRINARPPHIACVPAGPGAGRDGLSTQLLQAIGRKLEQGEQTLVFLNRRGYSPVLMCHSCGWLSGCHRCSANLVLHMPGRELHCHHCGHRTPVPMACPGCGNLDLSPIGQGTQRVEDALKRHFPGARILRIDRDTTRRKHAFSEMRSLIRGREVDILVGTQILAKGHDFPHLALVGVLNADSMLYSADYRAAERLYALLTQVSGRAGRGDAQGEVLVQTEFPGHPLYAALRAQDFRGYATELLSERAAGGFPPYVHQALLRAEAPQVDTALEFLREARKIGTGLSEGVTLYDPVPASMVRLAGRERAQLLVQSASRPALQSFLGLWTDRLASARPAAARWALEVDPLEL